MQFKGPTDFVIMVNDYEWQLHSAIFVQKSEYFKALMGREIPGMLLLKLQSSEVRFCPRNPSIDKQSFKTFPPLMSHV